MRWTSESGKRESFSVAAPRLGIMQKGLGAEFAYLGPRMAGGICKLGFGIWDLDGKTQGLRAQRMGILQWGSAPGGCFAVRAAKLGFCIIHPAGGETVLQNC